MTELLYRKRCICGSSDLMDAWYREKNEIGVVCMRCGYVGPVVQLPESKMYSKDSANQARQLWNNVMSVEKLENICTR
jgi:Zn ribbon nucleic-acid-binding protein